MHSFVLKNRKKRELILKEAKGTSHSGYLLRQEPLLPPPSPPIAKAGARGWGEASGRDPQG